MIDNTAKQVILDYLRPYNPTKVGVFGSYARNSSRNDSDIDLLVSFRNRVNLLELIGIEQELSQLLGTKVDLVTDASILPSLRPFIEKDLQIILSDEE